MSHFAAVLDANVLYSYPLTSVLLELAEARLYRPIWSADIHAEWIGAITANRPDIDPAKLERRFAPRRRSSSPSTRRTFLLTPWPNTIFAHSIPTPSSAT